mmetsp:Transcript_59998/g.119055  ORF Transcript_59998/g.119055 Transcript_59998/m.119055 type:complete len:146 (-) Transcript_59998:12-449(-)
MWNTAPFEMLSRATTQPVFSLLVPSSWWDLSEKWKDKLSINFAISAMAIADVVEKAKPPVFCETLYRVPTSTCTQTSPAPASTFVLIGASAGIAVQKWALGLAMGSPSRHARCRAAIRSGHFRLAQNQQAAMAFPQTQLQQLEPT